jgi:hypothetical protein
MLIKFMIGVVVLVVILAIALATRPKTFRVERSILVNAPADVVFPFINDFHRWNLWSPFEKLDPNLQRTFTGPAAGQGATYEWLGNREAGKGKMVIKESTPARRVAIDLFFLKPFKSTSLAEFAIVPEGSGTKVTWAMSGNNTTAAKAISLVASMDKYLGNSFDEGLGNLKRVAEAEGV